MLALIVSLVSCRGRALSDDEASEVDTVSGAEMPVGQSLALDSTHNIRVVEHGLQFEEGMYTVNSRRWVTSTHKYGRSDTAFFTPVVKGYGVANGKVSVSSSWKIFSSAGRLLREADDGKTVHRFPEDEASYASFMVPVATLDSLDSTATHFDVRYELKDRITGKSIEGLYRIHMDRLRW